MIRLIRNNSILASIAVLLIVIASKYKLFVTEPLLPREIPFIFSVSGISFSITFSFWIEAMLVIALLLIQGIWLQAILIRHRFLDEPNILLPAIYLFAGLTIPDHLRLNDGIWVNFIILLLVSIIMGFHDKEGVRDTVYLNIGLILTIALLVLPSMWLLIIFVIIAVNLFVVITGRQAWLIMLSASMAMSLIFSVIYLTGNLDTSSWDHKLLPTLPNISIISEGGILTLFLLIVFAMIGVIGSLGHLQLRSNRVRNQFWVLTLLYLTALIAILLYPDMLYFGYQLLVIPFSAIITFLLMKNSNRWVYEGVFILLIWCFFIVEMGYF